MTRSTASVFSSLHVLWGDIMKFLDFYVFSKQQLLKNAAHGLGLYVSIVLWASQFEHPASNYSSKKFKNYCSWILGRCPSDFLQNSRFFDFWIKVGPKFWSNHLWKRILHCKTSYFLHCWLKPADFAQFMNFSDTCRRLKFSLEHSISCILSYEKAWQDPFYGPKLAPELNFVSIRLVSINFLPTQSDGKVNNSQELFQKTSISCKRFVKSIDQFIA